MTSHSPTTFNPTDAIHTGHLKLKQGWEGSTDLSLCTPMPALAFNTKCFHVSSPEEPLFIIKEVSCTIIHEHGLYKSTLIEYICRAKETLFYFFLILVFFRPFLRYVRYMPGCQKKKSFLLDFLFTDDTPLSMKTGSRG